MNIMDKDGKVIKRDYIEVMFKGKSGEEYLACFVAEDRMEMFSMMIENKDIIFPSKNFVPFNEEDVPVASAYFNQYDL